MDIRDRIGMTQFSWAQALWLPKWEIHALPTYEQKVNIVKVAQKLDRIQSLFKKNVFVTSWLRPEKYNALIGGAENSSHIKGMAVDFYLENMSCDELRVRLEPKLEELQLRMENKPKSSWVHIDVRDVGPGGRFFIP